MMLLSFLLATLVFAAQFVAADVSLTGTVAETESFIAETVLQSAFTPEKRVAVVFTDIKFDDKLASHFLSHSKRYETIIAVITGVQDQDRAHGDLYDFLEKMNDKARTKMTDPPVEVKVLKVEEGNRVDHESNFLGKSRPTELYNDRIDQYVEDATLEIFQIAPTAREHIWKLIKMENKIALYHLVHGYNSYLAEKGSVEKTETFVKAIGNEIHKKNRDAIIKAEIISMNIEAEEKAATDEFDAEMNDDNERFDKATIETIKTQTKAKQAAEKAAIVFTSNFASFTGGGGGRQPYKYFKDGQVPYEHLAAAANDPFYVRQFMKAMEVLEQAKMHAVVDQLQRAAQLISNWDSELKLKLEDFNSPELPKRVLEAKKDPKKVVDFVEFIQFAVKRLPGTLQERSLKGFVTEYLMNEGPISTPYMDYLKNAKMPSYIILNGKQKYENEFQKLHDFLLKNEDWNDALKLVKAVEVSKKTAEAVEDMDASDKKPVLYNPRANEPIVPARKWDDDEGKALAKSIMRARKNEEGKITEALRTRFLHFIKAVRPVVLNWHPKSRGAAPLRWKSTVPKAFQTELTVEVCEANHIVLVFEAFVNPDKLERKLQDMAFDHLAFKTNDVEEPDGKTLTEVTAADSFKLLEPYLLKTSEQSRRRNWKECLKRLFCGWSLW